MDFRHIEHFLWVYRHRSELNAARALTVAQSTLSMTVRRLELELGVKLFERTPYGLAPTPSARHLHRMCEPVLRNAVFACRYLASHSALPPLDLSIRAPMNVPGSLLCDAIEHGLEEVGRQCPHVQSRLLYEVTVDGRMPAPGAAADIAIAYQPLHGDPEAAEAGAETVSHESWVAVTTTRADPAPPGRTRLSLLRGLAIVTPPLPHHLRRDLSARFRRARVQPGSMGVANIETMHVELLSRDAQVGLVPVTALHPGLRNPQLRLNPVAEDGRPAKIVVCARGSAAKADPVRCFARAFGTALRSGLDRMSAALASVNGAG